MLINLHDTVVKKLVLTTVKLITAVWVVWFATVGGFGFGLVLGFGVARVLLGAKRYLINKCWYPPGHHPLSLSGHKNICPSLTGDTAWGLEPEVPPVVAAGGPAGHAPHGRAHPPPPLPPPTGALTPSSESARGGMAWVGPQCPALRFCGSLVGRRRCGPQGDCKPRQVGMTRHSRRKKGETKLYSQVASCLYRS